MVFLLMHARPYGSAGLFLLDTFDKSGNIQFTFLEAFSSELHMHIFGAEGHEC